MRKPFIISALCCLLLTLSAQGEPILWFENGGAGFWTPSNDDGHIHAIDGGSRLMIIWAETAQGSGENAVFYQIVSSHGEFELDHPERLTPPNIAMKTGGVVASDRQGNSFVLWSVALVDAPGEILLYAQKINNDGEFVWGDEGLFLGQFTVAVRGRVFPDNFGGCYYISLEKCVAVDRDGNIRVDWHWHNRPIEGFQSYYVYDDGLGGFWYVYYENENASRWAHLNYDGERTDHNVNNELPGDNCRTIGSYNGDLIYVYTNHTRWPEEDTLGIFRIDSRGRYRGEDYVHRFRVERNSGWTQEIQQLRSGKIVLGYTGNHKVLYDPVSNSLPWGSGIQFDLPSGSSLFSAFESVGRIDGDNTLLIYHSRTIGRIPTQQFHLRTIDPEGNPVDNDFSRFEGFSDRSSACPAPNGQFWLYGLQSRGYFENYRVLLNRFDSNGRRLFNEDILAPLPYRNYIKDPFIWFDDRGVFHILFSQLKKGLYHIGLNTDGEVVGDPNGMEIFVSDSFGLETNDFSGLALSNRILYLYRPSHHDTLLPPRLLSLSHSGELQWMTSLDIGLPDVCSYLCMAVDENEGTAAVMLIHRDPDQPDATSGYVIGINLPDGRRIWQFDLPFIWSEYNDRFGKILFSNGSFYTVNWQQDDSLYIDKFDIDGNRMWQSPFKEASHWPERIFDAAPDNAGGLWLGKWITLREQDSTVVWLERIDLAGQRLGERLPVYGLTGHQSEFYYLENQSISLIPSGDNVWIVPDFTSYYESNLGIQCLSGNDRLLGALGWQPVVFGAYNSSFKGIGDEEGGLWLFWDNQLNTGNNARGVHFNSNAELYDGYDEEGLLISDRSGAYYNPIHRLWDGSIAMILSVASPAGQSYQYGLQYIGEHTPEHVESGKSLPEGFRLLSAYPQPFNSRFNVVYEARDAGVVDIEITDLLGRVVDRQSFTMNAGTGLIRTINLENNPVGIYLLSLKKDEAKAVRKIVLLK